MKLGVVSDTHDNLEKTKEAVSFFEQEQVDTVVHCGDMVSPFTAGLFDADFEFHYVRGNNDGEWNLKETIEGFGTFYNNIAELEIEGNFIAAYHGTEEAIMNSLVHSFNYDYVLRGHTHEKKIYDYGGCIEINPGGIKLPGQEEELHVATLDLETGEVEFHRVQ
ncbi:metallophosphoesterase [Candidatus Nanohalococcus occultus]|uniref:Phosphoesterase n=1 Tax=Candidatus Nanohalococcus occultus TaxID=2978047 RepID=A0ABY8CIC5_9ARCH|nr:ICC-like phosphoesterase [Candidatus Nanohaloarchaeota archaeon SVXNc]